MKSKSRKFEYGWGITVAISIATILSSLNITNKWDCLACMILSVCALIMMKRLIEF